MAQQELIQYAVVVVSRFLGGEDASEGGVGGGVVRYTLEETIAGSIHQAIAKFLAGPGIRFAISGGWERALAENYIVCRVKMIVAEIEPVAWR